MKKLLFVVNVDWFFLSHRLPIALAAQKKGFCVYIATSDTGSRKVIEGYGFQFIHLPVLEKGGGIIAELSTFLRLLHLFRKVRPEIVHHVTIRPVMYGSIAARLAGVPSVVNALSGLGYLYINETLVNKLLRPVVNICFRLGFGHKNSILILQNSDDFKMISSLKLIKPEKVSIIRGSGVNINQFAYSPEQKKDKVKVALIGRMLWDKGVGEFVRASEQLVEQGIKASFHLYGAPYPNNPMSISKEVLKKWNSLDFIECHGHVNDVAIILKDIDIVCLPSYREGLPKSLLEAAACGKPIVATNVPGCREIVNDGKNGFLVPVKDHIILANKIKVLVNDSELRHQFGLMSRKKVVEEFSEKLVVNQTLKLYKKLLDGT